MLADPVAQERDKRNNTLMLGQGLSGHHSLFSVHMLFPQVFLAFIHGLFRQRERQIHRIALMFTNHIYIHGRMVH